MRPGYHDFGCIEPCSVPGLPLLFRGIETGNIGKGDPWRRVVEDFVHAAQVDRLGAEPGVEPIHRLGKFDTISLPLEYPTSPTRL